MNKPGIKRDTPRLNFNREKAMVYKDKLGFTLADLSQLMNLRATNYFGARGTMKAITVERADYYFERPGYTVVLTPTSKPFEDGHKYRHYLINGKMYESLCTSPYKDLTGLKKRTHENITFEFVEVEEEEEDD